MRLFFSDWIGIQNTKLWYSRPAMTGLWDHAHKR
jgi:hypothetical protein